MPSPPGHKQLIKLLHHLITTDAIDYDIRILLLITNIYQLGDPRQQLTNQYALAAAARKNYL